MIYHQMNEVKIEINEVKNELDDTKSELATSKTKLDLAEVKIESIESELVETQGELAASSESLVYVKEQLENTESELVNTRSQLTTVNTRLESVQGENERMLDDYASLREVISLRAGDDSDGQSFITPDDPLVIEKVGDIAGPYSGDSNERWTAYKKFYDWIVNFIEYNSDSYLPLLPPTLSGSLSWTKDFWRMPEETIQDGVGDCEDMAVLLASMMLCYNQEEYTIWVIEIGNDDIGHLAVAFPVVNDRLCILDPAGNYYTNQWGYLTSSGIRDAIQDWLSHWQTKIPGAEVTAVFNHKFYREFSNTEEFIQWAID